MLSRRELFAAGVAGTLTAAPVAAEDVESLAQEANREGQKEIAGSIRAVSSTLDRAFLSNDLSFGSITKIRDLMQQHFRSTSRFPDYIDIGFSVFVELYDWHVRHGQQLLVARAVDGRYTIQFMFTTMVLRHEVDQGFIGVPYEKG